MVALVSSNPEQGHTLCSFLANYDSEIKQINLIFESQIFQTTTHITVLF